MATYHRVGCFPPRERGGYLHEIWVSFDAEAGSEIGVSEGWGYHNHGGKFGVQEALDVFSGWFDEPEMAWLRPWLEALARGETIAVQGVLGEYRDRHGTTAEQLEW